MSLTAKRILFFTTWVGLLLLGPITIFSNTPWASVSSEPALLINLFQRLTGLTLFTLIFSQVILGSLMSRWTEHVLGAKAFTFHVTEGLVTYGLILAHPTLQSLLDYRAAGLTYALVRILPSLASEADFYLTLGKIAFVLLSIGVFAGYFRTRPFLRVHWQNFHRLNYVGFYVVALHAWLIGSDARTVPFAWFLMLATAVVTGIVLFKIYTKIVKPALLVQK